ncbi:MAG: hypothetical protein WDZ29_06635 [Balneolaceae bacterium]
MISRLLNYLEEHRFLLFFVLTLLTLVTLALTLLPSDSISDQRIFHYDKVGHFLMFGSWTFLLGLSRYISLRQPLPLFPIFIAGSLFGFSMEILQELLPIDRQADLYDAIADVSGCLAAVILLKLVTLLDRPGNRARN